MQLCEACSKHLKQRQIRSVADQWECVLDQIPFMRPSVVPPASYTHYLEDMQQSAWYSNFGPLNTRFESRVLAELFDGRGAVTTVSNATLGLMVAIQAVKRPGAIYAVMPSFTFAATALAAQWCGLQPYFVDCDPDTWCICPTALHRALDLLGDSVAVVVPYATFGYAMDLTPYRRLIEAGMPVVLDAAPCLGTQDAGSQFGRDFPGLTVFSMHATKAFAIGEGGLIYSASQEAIGKVRRMTSYGFDSQRSAAMQGLNAKLPEALAAVGLATLDVYAAKIARRMDLFKRYVESFESAGLLAAGWLLQRHREPVAHQFFPAIAPAHLSNADVVKRLAEQGIEARTYFAPACHQQAQFAPCLHDGLTLTERLTAGCVSLPLWEAMDDTGPQAVVRALANIHQTEASHLSKAPQPIKKFQAPPFESTKTSTEFIAAGAGLLSARSDRIRAANPGLHGAGGIEARDLPD
jgi:dTDP-4-amino-4,6-dideoxygalactose transaminase